MAEPDFLKFEYKEVATALVKQAGVHSGIWAIYVEFGIAAGNVTDATTSITMPTAFVPVVRVGLRRTTTVDGLSIDAAEVNPGPKAAQSEGDALKRNRVKQRAPRKRT